MKIYPDEKPTLQELTLQIMCALFASGHYTYPADEDQGEPPGFRVRDNGKNWNEEDKDEPGPRIYTGRYSTRALSDAMEIAMELMREMDLEVEYKIKDGQSSSTS